MKEKRTGKRDKEEREADKIKNIFSEEDISTVESGETEKGPRSSIKNELDEVNDKYLRLYAEFENYRKRMIKEKEDLHKYGSESVVYELLPVIDNLELALSHVKSDTEDSLVQGVNMTLKELKRTLGKFGLSKIESQGKPFDPQYHHAMAQIERDDVEEKTVVEEFRKGYIFKDRVMRPSLVSVSKKPGISYNEPEEKEKTIDIKEENHDG